MKNPQFATHWNAEVIDEYYNQWLRDASVLDGTWNAFFEGFELARTVPFEDEEGNLGDGGVKADFDVMRHARKQARFTGAIYAFRSIGHTQAHFNPLLKKAIPNPRLSMERLGFKDADLNEKFDTGNYLDDVSEMSVRDLLDRLKQTYCGPIGVEYLHIQETPKRRWLQSRMEPSLNRPAFSQEKRKDILFDILEAEVFEKFLQARFVGQKRFSLEGGETIIACLKAMEKYAPNLGIKEIVMGMAHRGRLNVLANVLGKGHEFIFQEFSENYVPDTIHGDGDVKYHLGYNSEVTLADGEKLNIYLAANPSHLEAVNPIVEGRARARQRILKDTEGRKQVLPVLIHGDAAFAGQGMVAEVLNLSQLKGYTTGGTIHFIINNQIGFTTDPDEARSTRYCTDVAKMIESPVFHVNGDDPEAMVYVTQMAMDYRQEFGDDVVIDMYCYRRQGHNETDEPAFTQPLLYRQIKDHPLITDTYAKRLTDEAVISQNEVDAAKDDMQRKLDESLSRAKEKEEEKQKEREKDAFKGSTAVFQPDYTFKDLNTRVAYGNLEKVAKALSTIPDSFKPNTKIKRLFKQRWDAFSEDSGIDWALAEQLAFGTLMVDGTPVRLSGQDCARGTFSQRHAVVTDMETREKYIPLKSLPDPRGEFCVHNSLLSEAAVLGFDYGYSLDYPEMLCIWEAQFGDFVNGAQVIIDQFITSSESKWQRVSGIVLLLPHGYEGQGPEHSSARLERFLQACAETNLQVANLTTPAQYFHLLRRQMKRDFTKPLVIMSPKSLLRHKEATSKIVDFTHGGFRSILPQPDAPSKPKRVILCSGKVYYDLIAYQRDNDTEDTTIVRLEQFYPFNHELMTETLEGYGKFKHFVWCQEEPANMGGWSFVRPLLEEVAGRSPIYAGRDAAASPAVGSLARHKQEQAQLVNEAFTLT